MGQTQHPAMQTPGRLRGYRYRMAVTQFLLSACGWPPANAGDTGQEDPLEKEMATHSSIFAREIPWTEEPGGLQSMGLQKSLI